VDTTLTSQTLPDVQTFQDRRKTADRIFRGAVAFNTALTLF
jgi:hypothetical protein